LTLPVTEAYTAEEAPDMSSPFLALTVASTLGFLPASFSSTRTPVHDQGQNARTRSVYVTVLDSHGVPVTDLKPDDFLVREDGVRREVLTVAPADEPLDITVLVDDSAVSRESIPRVREGVQAFVDALQGKAHIALVEIGERPAILVSSTNSAEALKRGIGRIFTRPDSGAYLLEGITEASQGLRARQAKRPVIVAITFESATEFSTESYQRVLEELDRSGSALYVLALGTPVVSNTDEARNRNVVIADGTDRTGGRREQVLSDMGLPDKMKAVAADLMNQLLVTYGAPETLIPPEKLSVSVSRPGLTARARTRVTSR
jgi:VWFA-related protein